jgi:hypothetical protein
MGDEPKRLSEIGQLLNRVDVPNLQYATRKLVRAGPIETESSSSRKETRYRATATGRSVTGLRRRWILHRKGCSGRVRLRAVLIREERLSSYFGKYTFADSTGREIQ